MKYELSIYNINPVEIIQDPAPQEVITTTNNANEIKSFNNELFDQVRFVEINGKPYAVGSDVARALGYSNTNRAITTHCKNYLRTNVASQNGMSDTKARNSQEMLVIPEGDIYRLIVRSKLPGAERFETWVFDEVLPQIRMTGGYIKTTEEDTPETIMAKALIVAKKTLDNKYIRF